MIAKPDNICKKYDINLQEKIEQSNNIKIKEEEEALEKKIFLSRIVTNIILSLILIINFFIMWSSYTPAWKIFFFLTIWSFWSNTFYMISITIIDIFLYRGNKKFEKYNNFIRNYFIRIVFPFSISTVVIYWELVLLGDKFQGIGHTILDICKSFFMHGLVLIFMLFDIFTSHHVNKRNNYKLDILIISIIMLLHFAAVILSKQLLKIHPYDFLMICDTRQMIGSFIIIYFIVLNGYVVLYLISENFFDKEEINKISEKKKEKIFENLEKECKDYEDEDEDVGENNKKKEIEEKFEDISEDENIEKLEEKLEKQEEKKDENNKIKIESEECEQKKKEIKNDKEKCVNRSVEIHRNDNEEKGNNNDNKKNEENINKENINKNSFKSLTQKTTEQILAKNKKRNLHIIINNKI